MRGAETDPPAFTPLLGALWRMIRPNTPVERAIRK